MKHLSKHTDAYTRKSKHATLLMHGGEDMATSIEYTETKEGYSAEWHLPANSTLQFFVIEGEGTFTVDGEAFHAAAKDVVNVGPSSIVKLAGVMKYLTIIGPSVDRLKAYDED